MKAFEQAAIIPRTYRNRVPRKGRHEKPTGSKIIFAQFEESCEFIIFSNF
jgi:hypothetical protein